MATAIDLPARADVAIVGGGFAGCATAWALAGRGVRAVVLEREPELGRYASGRGAGLGRQLAEDDVTTGLTVRGADLLRRCFPEAWTETGGLLGFDDPRHADAYTARAGRFALTHEVLDRAAVRARWPAFSGLSLASAIFVPTDGVIDTRALLAGLADGVEVVFEAPVVRVSDGRVETARGVVEARVVVDAAGAWAGAPTGDPPLDVYKRHLFVLEAAAPPGAPYLWHLGREELYVRGDGDHVLVSPCDAHAHPAGRSAADGRRRRLPRGAPAPGRAGAGRRRGRRGGGRASARSPRTGRCASGAIRAGPGSCGPRASAVTARPHRRPSARSSPARCWRRSAVAGARDRATSPRRTWRRRRGRSRRARTRRGRVGVLSMHAAMNSADLASLTAVFCFASSAFIASFAAAAPPS